MGRNAAVTFSAGAVENALAEVWERHLPTVLARLDTIDLAVAELSRVRASHRRLETGGREAHKLAGVLGTFGLDRGTELARDLELHLPGPDAGAEAPRLRRLAADLRATVESARDRSR